MNFRIGSIPVRVHVSFFLTMLFLGAGGANADAMNIVLWAGVAFVSVLIHELGHALMGKAFGLVPQIDLHGMGGLTSWVSGARKLTPWRSILVSLAGPFAGFAVGALALALNAAHVLPQTPFAANAYSIVLWVNIGWGVFNLLPMLPLDGGNVMASFLRWIFGARAERPARYVSIVVAVTVAAFAAAHHWIWVALIAGIHVIQNVQSLRLLRTIEDEGPNLRAIQQAYVALEKEDARTAIALVAPVIETTRNLETYQAAVRLLAYARLLEGQWGLLLPILQAESEKFSGEELDRFARTAEELGHPEEASLIRGLRLQAAPASPLGDSFKA